jgi:predicted unusual protein kinase regulating ubiquinone biosynthesis (AarF/ABC1/UbiB family)
LGACAQAGQFVGSRGEFVPPAVCRQLAGLQDKVPPMSPPLVRSILARELHPRSVQVCASFLPKACVRGWTPLWAGGSCYELKRLTAGQRGMMSAELRAILTVVWMSQEVFYDIDLESPLGSASIAQARFCLTLRTVGIESVSAGV